MSGERSDRGIPDDKARIDSHTGIIASTASGMDHRMSDLIALLTNFEHPDVERLAWNRQRTVDKIKRLRKLFSEWPQGGQLMDGASNCFAYRNSLSHGSVRLRFETGGQSVIWERISEGGDGPRVVTPIDIAALRVWEMRFWVVDYCFRYLIYPGTLLMRDHKKGPEILNLRHALEEDEASESNIRGAGSEWDQAKDWLFPAQP